jgi:hypothetical protein
VRRCSWSWAFFRGKMVERLTFLQGISEMFEAFFLEKCETNIEKWTCFDGFLRFLEGFLEKWRKITIFFLTDFWWIHLVDGKKSHWIRRIFSSLSHCGWLWHDSQVCWWNMVKSKILGHILSNLCGQFSTFGCPIPDRQVASSSHSERHSLGNLLAQNQHLAARVGRTQGVAAEWLIFGANIEVPSGNLT